VAQRTGPRQTIVRGKTQDRNGRIVTVERVERPSIRPVLEPETRNAKRFAAGNAAPNGEGRARTQRQSDRVREKKAEAKSHDPKPFNRSTAEKKPFRKRDEGYDERPVTGRSFEKRQLSARSYQGKEAALGREGGRPFKGKPSGGRSGSGKPFGGKPSGPRGRDR